MSWLSLLLNLSWIFLCILFPLKIISFLMATTFCQMSKAFQFFPDFAPFTTFQKGCYGCMTTSQIFPRGISDFFQSVHLIDHVYFPSPCGSLSAAIRQKLDLKHPFHVLRGEFLKPSHLFSAFGAKPKREALSIKRLSKWIM